MAVADADIDWLTSKDAAPMFWTPERLDRRSAWWGHVPFAWWITAKCRPRVLVELGTHHGVSYAAFCQAVARSGLATRCYAVDTWAGDAHAGRYGDDVYDDFRAFHDQRYASFSQLLRRTFDEANKDFADGSIDLLHIDGYHTDEAVRHDFETWRPKLSERAIVLFHDTNERRDDFGVWRFFDELKRHTPSFEFLHCHGLGVAAVGAEAPEAIRRLCGLTQDDEIAAARERFSCLGARWMAAADAVAERTAAFAERTAAFAEKDAASAERDAAAAERDRAVVERDAAVAERTVAFAERDSAVAERDVASAERDAAAAERDSAVAERDVASAERDAAAAERDSAVVERDAAVAERTALVDRVRQLEVAKLEKRGVFASVARRLRTWWRKMSRSQ